MSGSQPNPMSRRGFLGLAGAALAVPALAACNVSGSSNQSGSSGGAAGELKFWDMPWGTPAYSELGKKIVDGYTPPQGFGKATYQTIQWNGFYQTFSSAIASKTGPAVSSGAGFQAFQFAEQGAVAYADKLLESLKSDPALEFLPGLVDTLKTPEGYVAVPWQTDVRPLWYNKALLEQAGTKVPTTWDELLTAGQALKKIGVSGFATGAGSGNNLGAHTMVAMMINNGGGLFTPDGKPDCVTDANIQAMQFVQQLANEGIIDKGAVSYTTDNLASQWNTSMYMPNREKPMRCPSITASRRRGAHSMPVSSRTSLTATSAGE